MVGDSLPVEDSQAAQTEPTQSGLGDILSSVANAISTVAHAIESVKDLVDTTATKPLLNIFEPTMAEPVQKASPAILSKTLQTEKVADLGM